MADISNINLPNGENYDIKDKVARNDIAINRTTLGVQCKNLLDWKNATYSTSLRLTQTKTESGISVTSTGSWAVTAYKLPVLEVGTNYIFSTTISDLSVAGGKAYVVISTSTSSSNIVKAAEITNNGTATIKFEATSNTMYVLFYPNYSDTVYTNSFTASNIMLRYADITDATYEPYKETVDERLIKNKSDIAVNKTTLGYQRKNLLKNTAKTSTMSGVTFTVNTDKSVTANGTNSTSNYANIIVFKGELEGGTYTLTGAVSDVFRIRLGMGTSADGYGAYVGLDKGNGYTFTVAEKALYTVTCQVESGKTASNVIFKPMIRDADIMDDTYEEYIEDINTRLNNLLARIEILEGSSS